MDKYTNELVKEHAQLVVRIDELEKEVYTSDNKSDNFSKVEYANQAIQLASMKKYAECLEARLNNRGVYFDEGQYLERVATIKPGNLDDVDDKDNNDEND